MAEKTKPKETSAEAPDTSARWERGIGCGWVRKARPGWTGEEEKTKKTCAEVPNIRAEVLWRGTLGCFEPHYRPYCTAAQ